MLLIQSSMYQSMRISLFYFKPKPCLLIKPYCVLRRCRRAAYQIFLRFNTKSTIAAAAINAEMVMPAIIGRFSETVMFIICFTPHFPLSIHPLCSVLSFVILIVRPACPVPVLPVLECVTIASFILFRYYNAIL